MINWPQHAENVRSDMDYAEEHYLTDAVGGQAAKFGNRYGDILAR